MSLKSKPESKSKLESKPKLRLSPMLARSAEAFSDPQWIFEVKWDGTRALCYVNDKMQFINRRGTDITYRYPELETMREDIHCSSCVLDGEIVVLRKGKPSFSDLQKREHTDNTFKIKLLSKQMPVVYIVFDILRLEGTDMVRKPLLERKQIVKETISESSRIMLCPFIEEKGKQYFEVVTEEGFEGVMAKRKDSLYYPGKRSDAWLKIKKTKTIDCVIGGFTEGEGVRKDYFGALLLGVNQPMQYIGKVGTGFTEKDLLKIYGLLKDVETGVNPFMNEIPMENVHFTKPVYVCEVKYLELTGDRKLRAPVFLRLRSDKEPDECTLRLD